MPRSIYVWLAWELFCGIAPTALILLVRLASPNPQRIESMVGYSVILLVGFGVYLSTLSDVLVSRSLEFDWRGIATMIFGGSFVGLSAIGSLADELAGRFALLSFYPWLIFQIGFTVAGLAYCAMIKSHLEYARFH